ncbi:MAG: precorrin-2 C(20)-methyltransferase [Lachnospiraceae bacterium]
MSGTLYGIGVGPGDPELLTIKAIRTIKNCQVIAIAVSDCEFTDPVFESHSSTNMQKYLDRCVAYQIVLPELPMIADMELLYLPMPMIKDKERLKEAHEKGAKALGILLDEEKHVAVLTLGDPTVYSTYLYLHKRMTARGYQTKIIPGIPSFCAVAARLNVGLVENKEELHILPASYGIEEGLSLSGTKVFMKAGKSMPFVKQKVKEQHMKFQMIENCGMENEHIYDSVEDVPDQASYYSLIIMKEENQ